METEGGVGGGEGRNQPRSFQLGFVNEEGGHLRNERGRAERVEAESPQLCAVAVS